MTNLQVLIIDDQVALLRSLSLMLKTQKITSFMTLNDPTQAELFIEQHKPKIVLLDLNMPNVSGQKILSGITKKHPDICTIILSADDSIETQNECKELGAYKFFNKPVQSNELVNVIKGLSGSV